MPKRNLRVVKWVGTADGRRISTALGQKYGEAFGILRIADHGAQRHCEYCTWQYFAA